MKILFITPSVPYPPHTGGQLRSWYLLKCIATKGSVTLLSIGNSEQCEPYSVELKKYCHEVFLADPEKFQSKQLNASCRMRLKKLLQFQPWLLDDFVDPEVLRQIELSKPEEYDVIICRFAVMAYYFLTKRKFESLLERVVVDIDDISTIVQERKIKFIRPGYEKLRSLLDSLLLRQYYQKLNKARACFVVAERDRDYVVRNGISKKTFVVSNVFEVNGRMLTLPNEVKDPEILFCGMMSYPPNQEAVFYFCKDIFPKIRQVIPNAQFTVVGKHQSERINQLGILPGITVTGYVPSMEPYYAKASVVVVPLLNGGGTRIKILEAMAYGRPVVSTSIGAEGLEVTNGENILIADDPEGFAARCVELLQNPEKKKRIASNAYQLVKEKYDVSVFTKKMDDVFKFIGKDNECQP